LSRKVFHWKESLIRCCTAWRKSRDMLIVDRSLFFVISSWPNVSWPYNRLSKYSRVLHIYGEMEIGLAAAGSLLLPRGGSTMETNLTIRWGWIRFMYVFTLVVAGGIGLGIVFMPGLMIKVFGFPEQDLIILGIVGSTNIAFGVLSIFGLRSPLKFVPVLFMQICYKVVWIVGIFLPLVLKGNMPNHAVMLLLIFLAFIIGDCIAIPFSYLFSRESRG
jgi:hypothetical protein